MERADESGGEADSYQKLRQIYRDIQNGAKAFLAAEYRMCLMFLSVFGFGMIFFVARVESGWDFKIGVLTAFSFVVGGITSMVAGYIGMMIAVFTNARCTMSATLTPDALGWKESFNSAFRGGAVMGFALSGSGLLAAYFLMRIPSAASTSQRSCEAFECIVGFGLGGSAIAMFGRGAAGSTPRPRTSAISPARWSPASPRTTCATPRPSPTTSSENVGRRRRGLRPVRLLR